LTVALEYRGLRVFIAGPGQHASVIERMAQTVKSHFLCHERSLPFKMTHTILVCCMRLRMSCVHLQPSATSIDKASPFEQFFGMKLDAKRDLRVVFGDYVLATHVNTDNPMLPRAEPCIALGGKFNLAGSVVMLSLRTNKSSQEIGLSFSQCQISSSTRSPRWLLDKDTLELRTRRFNFPRL